MPANGVEKNNHGFDLSQFEEIIRAWENPEAFLSWLMPYEETIDRPYEINWVDEIDLNNDMIGETQEAYSEWSHLYGLKHWSFESIQIVYDRVLKRLLPDMLALNEGDEVLVGGAGTLMDATVMALINLKAKIQAYDLDEHMLEEGRAHFITEYLVALSLVVGERDALANGWIRTVNEVFNKIQEVNALKKSIDEKFETFKSGIDDISQHLAELLSNATQQIDFDALSERLHENLRISRSGIDSGWQEIVEMVKQVPQELPSSIQDRVITRVGEHTHLPAEFKNKPKKIITQIATFQHLPKEYNPNLGYSELEQAIATDLDLLDLNGVMYFNVKFDDEPLRVGRQVKGRVFQDNELGGHWRSYHTMSRSEVKDLSNRIMRTDNQAGLYCSPDLAQSLEGKQFIVDFEPASSHPNSNKPPYINFFIRRVA
jgi:hypothetical protein